MPTNWATNTHYAYPASHTPHVHTPSPPFHHHHHRRRRRRRPTALYLTVMSVASMPATPSATALSALNTSSSIPSDYSFNISFNLSLGSLLTALPSRIIHNLRRLEQINTEQTIRLQEELSRARVERQVAAGADPGTYMHPPGHPWAFLASGYVISLFIMVSSSWNVPKLAYTSVVGNEYEMALKLAGEPRRCQQYNPTYLSPP